jgi:arylformamidase
MTEATKQGDRPWSHYSDAEREVQYNARATAGDKFEAIMAAYVSDSAAASAALGGVRDVAYGPHPDETLDIYPAASANAPVFVFVHGGYWRMLSKNESSAMAPAFVDAGATVVIVNYQLAPAASIDEIVRQCRAALAWTYAHIAEHHGNPDDIHICGSSAGGHLVGMLLAGGWHASFGVPEGVVKSATPISGLFELEPLIGLGPNAWAKLDAESAHRLSPRWHLPEHGCPLIVSYGENETAEFKRQTDDYLAAWQAKGFEGRYVDMPGTNHFDIVLTLNDPKSPLTRAIFDVMKIG